MQYRHRFFRTMSCYRKCTINSNGKSVKNNSDKKEKNEYFVNEVLDK